MKRVLFIGVSFLSTVVLASLLIMGSPQKTGTSLPDPTTVTGLKIWLDPTDNSTITQSSSAVSQWNDKSGNANNFSQTGSSTLKFVLTPSDINGKQDMALSHANGTYMSITGATGFPLTNSTVCALIKPSSLTQFDAIYGDYAISGDLTLEIGPSSSLDLYKASLGATAGTGSSTLSTGTAYWACETYTTASGGTVTTYINNVLKTASSQSSATIHLGSTIFIGADAAGGFTSFNGELGDIVVYNSVLGSTDETTVYNYEKAKWGL